MLTISVKRVLNRERIEPLPEQVSDYTHRTSHRIANSKDTYVRSHTSLPCRSAGERWTVDPSWELLKFEP